MKKFIPILYTSLFLFIVTICLTLFSVPSSAKSSSSKKHQYQVIRVVDGDTFIATDGLIQFRVRILGVDTPEYQQPFSKAAKYELQKLLLNQIITLKTQRRVLDRYYRVLAHVYVDNQDIGLTLIQNGYGFYYRPTCKDYPVDKNKYDFDPSIYIQAENEAKKLKKNIWSHPQPEKPCDFRKRKKK